MARLLVIGNLRRTGSFQSSGDKNVFPPVKDIYKVEQNNIYELLLRILGYSPMMENFKDYTEEVANVPLIMC